MATHSRILAWRVPWTEEPGGLQSMGSQNQARLSDWAWLSTVRGQWAMLGRNLTPESSPCRGLGPSCNTAAPEGFRFNQ